MFQLVSKWFNPRISIQLVEVERPKMSLKWDAADAETISSLQAHPGFLRLLDKLRYQRAFLVSELVNKRQETQIESEFIKSGIAWTAWLEDQLAAAIKFKSRRVTEVPEPEVLDAFREMQAQLQVVGDSEVV